MVDWGLGHGHQLYTWRVDGGGEWWGEIDTTGGAHIIGISTVVDGDTNVGEET